ncbi:MAG: hypothetical protein ABH804_02460 [archaeon]
MLKKFLKEVIGIVVGKQSEEIADLLSGNKHINEFLIAKKLDITINQTRNILYKLSDYGLVSSIRKKDKRKGWYTYFWKIEILKCLEFLRGSLLKKIEQIRSQVNSRETKQFYVCERCSIEFTEENALLHDFTCNECGNVFSIKDNTKVIKELKRNLEKFEEELKLVETEIENERSSIVKKREKDFKREQKIKAKESAIKRMLKKKEKLSAKKISEKSGKKKTLKKTAKKSPKKPVKKTSKKKPSKKIKKKSKN